MFNIRVYQNFAIDAETAQQYLPCMVKESVDYFNFGDNSYFAKYFRPDVLNLDFTSLSSAYLDFFNLSTCLDPPLISVSGFQTEISPTIFSPTCVSDEPDVYSEWLMVDSNSKIGLGNFIPMDGTPFSYENLTTQSLAIQVSFTLFNVGTSPIEDYTILNIGPMDMRVSYSVQIGFKVSFGAITKSFSLTSSQLAYLNFTFFVSNYTTHTIHELYFQGDYIWALGIPFQKSQYQSVVELSG